MNPVKLYRPCILLSFKILFTKIDCDSEKQQLLFGISTHGFAQKVCVDNPFSFAKTHFK